MNRSQKNNKKHRTAEKLCACARVRARVRACAWCTWVVCVLCVRVLCVRVLCVRVLCVRVLCVRVRVVCVWCACGVRVRACVVRACACVHQIKTQIAFLGWQSIENEIIKCVNSGPQLHATFHSNRSTHLCERAKASWFSCVSDLRRMAR